jgi:hypothetical protein
MWLDEKLTSTSMRNPIFSICCNSAQIKIPLPRPAPEPLLSWITDHSNEPHAKELHKYIRAYNTVFAFASIAVEQVNPDLSTGLPRISGRISTGASNAADANQTFRINGTIYHRIGRLRPTDGPPKFAQVYFYDAHEQLQHRTSLISHLQPTMIEDLQQLITRHNPYTARFLTLYQQHGSQAIGTLGIRIRSGRELGRRYDAQTYPEISAMVTEQTVDGAFSAYDIVVHDHSRTIRTISSLNTSYIPLHYVLMYPFGEDGWSPDMLSTCAPFNKISMRGYCAYMIMVRDDYYIHHYDRLFQQFVVDNYVRIEAERLRFFALNQDQLRTELYNGIGDNADPRQVGQSTILPSSFHGGPRFMRQKLQDGLAIIRQKGKPSLFITVTCNPRWPEIVAALPPPDNLCMTGLTSALGYSSSRWTTS